MRRIAGTFNGTGADLYICIGFIPDWVHVVNLESGNMEELVWNVCMARASETVEGLYKVCDTWSELTLGNGIQQYHGGDTLTTTTAGTTTYGEGEYLKWDKNDYRKLSANSPSGYGDASEEDIDTWTLDDAAAYAGHWNGAVAGTYIGKGSRIVIDGKLYFIAGFTEDGSDGSDVVLNLPAKSGDVHFIGGMYDFKPMVAGEVTSEGFMLGHATTNVDDDMCYFEAGCYGN